MKKRYFFIVFIIIVACMIAYLGTFSLDDIQISGCEMVSEQTIIDTVKSKNFANNTVILYLRNKIQPIGDIPFVSKLDMEFLSKNRISITVYEKSVAGCIEYMDQFLYFDKDGLILESSTDLIDGIPCIKGLKFNSWEIGEKLPIDDSGKFQSILSITQLIDKYELDIDGIKFTTENEIMLIHKDITIELGEGEYLAIQMMNLGSILEGLEGKSGTLYMKDFNSDNATASFSAK